MAQYKIPYTGLNDSLKHLRIQIIDSLPYTIKNLPTFQTPQQIFDFCKSKFNYKSDPQGVELFQSVGTLLENNGQGDCDCATIFCISMLLSSGFTNCGIVLVGKNKVNPTHIYAYNINDKDEKQFLDLTNKNFDQIRPYPFKQSIPFKISKTQLDMFLQLADGKFNRKAVKQKINKLDKQAKEKGIYCPSKNVFLPHQAVDKLPLPKAKKLLLSEGYEIDQLSEYLSGRAERHAKKDQKRANKQTKFETKQSKKTGKIDRTAAKTERKRATATKRIARGEAKTIKQEGKRSKRESVGRSKETSAEAKRIRAEGGEETEGMKIFNKAGEFVTEVFNKPKEGEEEETDETETEETETEETEQPEETELEEGFLELNKKDFLNLAIFGIGIFLEKKKLLA